MIGFIIGVFVGGMIGTTIMALLSFRKLTEYEEEILELRRRERKGEHNMIGFIIGAFVGVVIKALLSFRKLTEYEEEILKLRRRVAELEEKE